MNMFVFLDSQFMLKIDAIDILGFFNKQFVFLDSQVMLRIDAIDILGVYRISSSREKYVITVNCIHHSARIEIQKIFETMFNFDCWLCENSLNNPSKVNSHNQP